MSGNKPSFIKLLKKHTQIDKKFVDTFFKKFKIGDELSFHVKDIDVAEYLGVSIQNIRRRLANDFSKDAIFVEKVDYIKKKISGTQKITYMLNYKCFEKIAMMGNTPKSAEIRRYFHDLRVFNQEYSDLIYQAMENKKELRRYDNFETIYFFAVDERHGEILKPGMTTNGIIRRLSVYNVGRIHEVDLKYLAIVRNSYLIEKCMKNNLRKYEVKENKELYRITQDFLEKIINRCYKKNTSREEHENLGEELSSLIGMSIYSRKKTNIKPYVIIKRGKMIV